MNKQQALKLAFSSPVAAQLPETTESIAIDFVKDKIHHEFYAEELMDTWQVLREDESVSVYIPSDFITIFMKALFLGPDDFDDVEITLDNDSFLFSGILTEYPSINLAKKRGKRRNRVTIPKKQVKQHATNRKTL